MKILCKIKENIVLSLVAIVGISLIVYGFIRPERTSNYQGIFIGWCLAFFSNQYFLEFKDKREKRSKIKASRRLLLNQLNYSLNFFSNRLDYENNALIIYLKEWPSCIEAACFTFEESDFITRWIQHLEIITYGAECNINNSRISFVGGSSALVQSRINKELEAEIKKIVNKYIDELFRE